MTMIYKSRALAIIDFDGTLFEGQSQSLFIKYLFEKRLINFVRYFLISLWFVVFRLGLVSDVRSVYEYAVGYLKGKEIVEFEKIFDDFFKTRCIVRMHKNAKNLIDILKERNMHTLLISTALDPIISRAQRYLGIDEFICTTLEYDKGKYTGKIYGEPVYANEKLQIAKEYARQNGYSEEQIYAFADHVSDIPLLTNAGHPIAVNPWPELLIYSKKQKWPVLYLNNDESFQYFKSHTLS